MSAQHTITLWGRREVALVGWALSLARTPDPRPRPRLCPRPRPRLDDLLGTVPTTPLARLDCTGEFLGTALFHQNIFPSLVQNLLDLCRHIDNLCTGDHLVVLLNVAVVEFLKVEAVWRLPILIHVWDLGLVADLAFAAQRRQWADIRVHRRKHNSCVIDSFANIFWSVIPVDAQSIHRLGRVVLHVQEFHDTA